MGKVLHSQKFKMEQIIHFSATKKYDFSDSQIWVNWVRLKTRVPRDSTKSENPWRAVFDFQTEVLGSQRLAKHFYEVAKHISGSVIDFLCPKTLAPR